MCAWCRTSISKVDGTDGPISHGICRPCADAFESDGDPVQEFLETLPGPVMFVDAEGRLLGANSAFASLVNQPASILVSRLGGDVISCVYATLPGGCGHTAHCTECPIRRAVNETRATGIPRVTAPAYAFVRGPDGPVRTLFHISLQRVGQELVLVRIDGARSDELPDVPTAGTAGSRLAVLVADDDDAVRRCFARVLSNAGYQVLESPNGKDAIRRVKEGRVDLLIADLVMPEQDGIETVIESRRLRPDLGIVAVSGAFGGVMLRAARLLGANAILEKPVSADLLLDTLRRVTRERRQKAGAKRREDGAEGP
jgi:CheY-like chemotaxis protein